MITLTPGLLVACTLSAEARHVNVVQADGRLVIAGTQAVEVVAVAAWAAESGRSHICCHPLEGVATHPRCSQHSAHRRGPSSRLLKVTS